jgi:hypothetical protein
VAKESTQAAVATDTNTDRYPTLKRIFSGVLQAEDVPEAGVMHLEVHTFANGDATWRAWVRGEDDARGGYLNGPET